MGNNKHGRSTYQATNRNSFYYIAENWKLKPYTGEPEVGEKYLERDYFLGLLIESKIFLKLKQNYFPVLLLGACMSIFKS